MTAKLMRFQIAGNFLGLPAISVPVSFLDVNHLILFFSNLSGWEPVLWGSMTAGYRAIERLSNTSRPISLKGDRYYRMFWTIPFFSKWKDAYFYQWGWEVAFPITGGTWPRRVANWTSNYWSAVGRSNALATCSGYWGGCFSLVAHKSHLSLVSTGLASLETSCYRILHHIFMLNFLLY